MGDSPEAIPARLARGETADVVIMDGGATDELGKRGLVHTGAAKPDIGSVEALRSALLAAKSIAYSDSGSGTYLATTLFGRRGGADQVAGKSRKVRGPPSGEPVATVVARGEAEIGFQPVSELIHVRRRRWVRWRTSGRASTGVFIRGGDYQWCPTAGGGPCADPRFLGSPEAASTILMAGLMPHPVAPTQDAAAEAAIRAIVAGQVVAWNADDGSIVNWNEPDGHQ